MNSLKTLSGLLLAVLIWAPTTALAISIDLFPASGFPTTFNGRQVNAVGKSGLFLDSDVSAPAHFNNGDNIAAFQGFSDPANNFTFQGVVLNINDATGNASVSGTVRNDANGADLYSLNMSLSGLCLKSGGACNAFAGEDLRAFLEDPANGQNSVLGLDLVNGLEWATVDLALTAIPGGPAPLYNGVENFVGWTMFPLHNNPVELEIWSNAPGAGNLYFNAWYQASNNAGKRIGVGDTKSFGALRPPKPKPPKPDPIPEPSTWMLLLVAAAGGLVLKKRRVA